MNKDGQLFLKSYFADLSSEVLKEEDELKLIEVAIETIKADDKVEYSEIKFFKLIRSKLKIPNKSILNVHPDFEEYLEQDILSDSYLRKLQNDFFDSENLNKFEFLNPSSLDLMSIINSSSK